MAEHLVVRCVKLRTGLRMPVLKYFFVVGAVLTGLLFYSNSVISPVPLPFSVSQRIGLPEPTKAAIVVKEPNRVIVATTFEPAVEAKKPVKLDGQRQPTRLVTQIVPQGHHAEYLPREHGSLW